MKRCPECGREYDNTMAFCLDDGAELLYGPATVDEPATAILSEPGAVATGFLDGGLPTRAQINTTDQTAIFRHGGEAEPQNKFGESTERQSLSAHRAAEPLVVVLFATLVLIGGFFGYRYFKPASAGQIRFDQTNGSAAVETDCLDGKNLSTSRRQRRQTLKPRLAKRMKP